MITIGSYGLSKTYEYYEKGNGIQGSLKNLLQRKKLFKTAVSDFSVEIQKGEIVGLIGLNGAGKTTTLKMLSGILKPTKGEVRVLGFDPFKKNYDFLKKITLVMGNKSQLWWDLPGIESFNLNRQIYEVDYKEYKDTLEELSNTLSVQHLLNIQVRRLSLGERMKMELIAALIHRPEIIFLDEPTIGLDFIAQKQIRDFLKVYNETHQTTVILTSHNLSDIVYLCNRLLIINSGTVIYNNFFNTFCEDYLNKKIIEVDLYEPISQEHYNKLLDNNTTISSDKIQMTVHQDNIEETTTSIIHNLRGNIKDIYISDIPIEDVIRDLYL